MIMEITDIDESDHLFPYLENSRKKISWKKNLEACVEEVQPGEKTTRQGKGDVMECWLI